MKTRTFERKIANRLVDVRTALRFNRQDDAKETIKEIVALVVKSGGNGTYLHKQVLDIQNYVIKGNPTLINDVLEPLVEALNRGGVVF